MQAILEAKIWEHLKLAIFGLVFLSSQLSFAYTQEIKLELGTQTFVLPQFTGPYSEREASIAPEEYEMAEQLKVLLEEDNKEEVLKQLESYYDIELSPAMLTLKAQIYFSIESFDEAEETFLEVLSRKPQLIRVHADLGQLYLFKEEYEKARKHFAFAINYGSNEAIVHGQLAYLNFRLNGPFSAISGYQQAMALEPKNIQWQQGLLSALTQAGMYQAAAALVEELIQKRPEDASLWLIKADLSIKTEKTRDALSSLEVAILLGEKEHNNLKVAAQLHLQMGSYERALQLLNESLDASTLNMNSINEYLVWLTELELWREADQLLSSTINRINSFTLAEQSNFYRHRAHIDSKLKRNQKAETHFNQALDLNPNNGDALLDYATFSLSQGDNVRAELLYIRAEALEETEKEALLGRAQLYLNAKDYESAIVQLRNAYVRYPDLASLKENIEIVERILLVKSIKN